MSVEQALFSNRSFNFPCAIIHHIQRSTTAYHGLPGRSKKTVCIFCCEILVDRDSPMVMQIFHYCMHYKNKGNADEIFRYISISNHLSFITRVLFRSSVFTFINIFFIILPKEEFVTSIL